MRETQYEQAVTLLPVIDLQDGLVVAARAGERERYAPIHSPLVAGSAPEDVLAALLQRTGGHAAYLADLDAIRRQRPQIAGLRALLARFPGLTLWLDGGFRSADEGLAICASVASGGAAWVRPVLGTETLTARAALGEPPLRDACALSLDFGPEGFRGDPHWLSQPQDWPASVIVMTLARVGLAQGPDLERLRQVRQLAAGRQVFAAGGVRDAQDVEALARIGVSGALVASALHLGTLPR